MDIPWDIWTYHIWPLLSLADKKRLRLTAKLFRELPWEQWVPQDEINNFLRTCRDLGWPAVIWGIKITRYIKPEYLWDKFSESLRAVDLCDLRYKSHLEFMKNLPKYITRVILQCLFYYSVADIWEIIRPDLIIEFGRWDVGGQRHTVDLLRFAIVRESLELIEFIWQHQRPEFQKLINKYSTFHEATPLVRSCTLGNYEITRSLLEKGADPNIPDNRGRKSLAVAVDHQNYDIARLLLKYNADMDGVAWSEK